MRFTSEDDLKDELKKLLHDVIKEAKGEHFLPKNMPGEDSMVDIMANHLIENVKLGRPMPSTKEVIKGMQFMAQIPSNDLHMLSALSNLEKPENIKSDDLKPAYTNMFKVLIKKLDKENVLDESKVNDLAEKLADKYTNSLSSPQLTPDFKEKIMDEIVKEVQTALKDAYKENNKQTATNDKDLELPTEYTVSDIPSFKQGAQVLMDSITSKATKLDLSHGDSQGIQANIIEHLEDISAITPALIQELKDDDKISKFYGDAPTLKPPGTVA